MLEEDIKRHFWEELGEVIENIPHTKRLFIRGDFNGHIRRESDR